MGMDFVEVEGVAVRNSTRKSLASSPRGHTLPYMESTITISTMYQSIDIYYLYIFFLYRYINWR
jgi:hypothetical protein